MSSEETNVVTLRTTTDPSVFPFQAQVEVPSAGLRKDLADIKVERALTDWAQREGWDISPVRYANDVNEDGMRVRVGRFTVKGYC